MTRERQFPLIAITQRVLRESSLWVVRDQQDPVCEFDSHDARLLVEFIMVHTVGDSDRLYFTEDDEALVTMRFRIAHRCRPVAIGIAKLGFRHPLLETRKVE